MGLQAQAWPGFHVRAGFYPCAEMDLQSPGPGLGPDLNSVGKKKKPDRTFFFILVIRKIIMLKNIFKKQHKLILKDDCKTHKNFSRKIILFSMIGRKMGSTSDQCVCLKLKYESYIS